jgi:protease-4
VILETGNVGGLLDKLGVSAEAIISGPLKDQPSFTHGLSPEGRTYLQALVMDMYGQFVTMVATARHLDEARVRALADGRAYTGRQALQLGLVDEIGGEPEARAWLERERQVSAALPVSDLKLGSLYERTIGATLEGLWPAALTQMLPQPGAWAIWRPGDL